MSIDYKNNQRIKKMLEVNIEKMGISDSFKPLLIEVMLRRASEFNFNAQEINSDIESLINNLDEISIDPMPARHSGAAGVYFLREKEIVISEEYVKKAKTPNDFETLYEIFTHEVFHALARDKFGNDKISGVNKYTKEYYGSLEEAIVEKAADRCVFGRNGGEPFYHQNQFGYRDITYITDIIEAAYGVPELAFLRHAIQGRKNVAEFLADVSGERPEDTLDFFDRVELNYSVMHDTLYSKNLPSQEIARIVKDRATAGMLVSSWKMNENIGRLKPNEPNFASRISDFKYGHDKFNVVSREVASAFESKFPRQNIFNSVLANIEGTRKSNSFRINTISEILKLGEAIPKEDFFCMIEAAQKGNATCVRDASQEDLFKKYDIPLEFDLGFIPLKDEELEMFSRMDFELPTWDNSGIIEQFRNIKKEHNRVTRKNPIIAFFKDKIVKTQEYFSKGNKPELLGPGQEDATSALTTNTEFGKLSKEELEKFEKGMAQVLNEYNVNQGKTSQKREEKVEENKEFGE